MLVVLAIFLTIVGLVFDSSFDNFEKSSVDTEADTLMSLLQHARAEAMSNICRDISCTVGSFHGILIINNSFIVFEGTDFKSSNRAFDQVTPRNSAFVSSGVSEISFENLSGNTINYGNIILENKSGQKIIVSVGQEGQISWQN